jgi:UDP-GlcNAc:undecaprenyl-phosphate GlcNAc-1-phosphate transferase
VLHTTLAVYASIGAFTAALIFTPLMMRLSPRIGAVAWPRERDVHSKPTPTAGGVAIFLAVWLPVYLLNYDQMAPLLGIFVGSCVLLLICLVDDIIGLPALPRLVGQVAVAVLAYAWGVRISGVTDPLSLFGTYRYLTLGWLSGPLTVLWIVLVVNAMNWLDGLDGLAAGVSAIAAATLVIIAWPTNFLFVAMPALVVTWACLGFLPYNFNPARIFMGDTGAMFLGYMLATLSVSGAFKAPTAVAVFFPLLVLGVPIYDSISTICKRLSQGKSIYEADQQHLHHRLLNRGLSTRQAVVVIYALTGVLCSVAILLWMKW